MSDASILIAIFVIIFLDLIGILAILSYLYFQKHGVSDELKQIKNFLKEQLT